MNREVGPGSHSPSHSSPISDKPYGFCGRRAPRQKKRALTHRAEELCEQGRGSDFSHRAEELCERGRGSDFSHRAEELCERGRGSDLSHRAEELCEQGRGSDLSHREVDGLLAALVHNSRVRGHCLCDFVPCNG